MSITINGQKVDSRTHEPMTADELLLSSYHITDENRTLYEPQRSTDFKFTITGLNNLKNIFGGAEYSEVQNTLSYAVVQCSLPHFKINPIEMRMGNSITKFAGTPTWESGTIKVRDFIGANTKSMLQAWQNEAYDVNTDKVGTLDAYQIVAYLTEYSPDRQVVRRYKLINCWISAISEDPFARDTNAQIHDITATIEFDRAIPLEGNSVGTI